MYAVCKIIIILPLFCAHLSKYFCIYGCIQSLINFSLHIVKIIHASVGIALLTFVDIHVCLFVVPPLILSGCPSRNILILVA
jgi:hypothetical protein